MFIDLSDMKDQKVSKSVGESLKYLVGCTFLLYGWSTFLCVLNSLALRSSHNRLNLTIVGGGSHGLACNACVCSCAYVCI